MLSPSPGTLSPGSSHFEAAFAQQRPVLLQAIAEYSLPIEPHWIESLIDAFVAEIAGDSDNRFLSIFNMILERVRHTESNILLWQNVISSLRQHVLTCLDSPALLVQAENLCGQARIMIGEAAHRKEIYQQWQTVLQAETLREINQLLMTTFYVEGVVEALNDGLARIKIPGCYLALYENPRPYTYPQRAPEWSRLILAYHESQRIELEAGGRRFPSHQLLPEGILSQDKPYTLVVEPLYFREEQIGFIMFEVGPRDGVIYETLRLDVSSTLKGALLMQQIQEHSAQLAREQYILDTFMATVPDRIYFKDLQGRITRANAAHAAWLGLRDSAEEIGKTDFDFFPEEEARLRQEQEQKIINTGESFVDQEELRSLPDGERMNWSLVTKMPLRNERGEIIGTFGISKDITDLKLAQKQLIQAEKMATLGELVAGVTHEINTPLGVGVTAASHLEANTREIEQLFSNNSITRSALEKYLRVARETSEIILRNLQRASDHIKGFKQVAVDQTHEERRRFTLKPYLEDVLKSLHPKIKNSGHRVTVTCPPNLELYSYPGVFSQIISNFVMNSLVHGFEQMSHGEIQIELTEEEDHLVLRYQDNGKGMDQETQDRIFDPFFTTKRGQGGSGLGMHIVYNLVTQQLSGQITCESSPNNGVHFLLRIPTGLA
jgi:PAS domain S-box-containing protein